MKQGATMPSAAETKGHAKGQNEAFATRRIFDTVFAYLQEVQERPENYLTSLGLGFFAGGGLVDLFGEDNEVWKGLGAVAESGRVEIAGIHFSLDELALMGEFSRWLGGTKHCIDERLHETLAFKSVEVHEHCGAAGAVAATLGGDLTGEWVENRVLEVKGVKDAREKQALLEGTEAEHRSIAVYVDLSGEGRAFKPELRQAMNDQDALAFHAALPVAKAQEFLAKKDEPKRLEELLSVLYRWNVQIAVNIIQGGHNEFREVAEEEGMIFLVDRRGEAQESFDRVEPLLHASQEIYQITRLDIQEKP
jgi:hypothetical protein